MNISVAYYSSTGGRKNNEDSLSIHENPNSILAVVADGLGGHAHGEIASQIAVQTMVTHTEKENRISVDSLEEAVAEANHRIIEEPESQGMKSTIAAVWFDNYSCLACTVGDTRIYHFRGDQILYQSRDHSVTQMEVLAGNLKKEEIRGNKDRNRLIRALGVRDDVKADIAGLTPEMGDAVLLCTDGFWEHIWESEMTDALKEASSATEWLGKMRERAETRMKENCDNNTAVCIIFKE